MLYKNLANYNEKMAGVGYDSWLLRQADEHEADAGCDEPTETDENFDFVVSIDVSVIRHLWCGVAEARMMFPENVAVASIAKEVNRMISAKTIDGTHLEKIEKPTIIFQKADDGGLEVRMSSTLFFSMSAEGRGCSFRERREDAEEILREDNPWLAVFSAEFDLA